MTTAMVDLPDGVIEVRIDGDGPPVVMIPSLGRGASDFESLGAAVAAAGFTAAMPEPRGIGATTAPIDDLTMFVLADDVAAVIRSVGGDGARATVVGHAFGNRVARMTATEHPDLVESVVLLACGGSVPPGSDDAAALRAVFDETLPADRHLAAVARAFFAEGNDPTVWSDGWFPIVARSQAEATRSLDVAHWWSAGGAPVLVVQPEEDVIAVSANAHEIVDRLGERARLVTVPRAGHALLPEQPQAVAAAVCDWLRRADR